MNENNYRELGRVFSFDGAFIDQNTTHNSSVPIRKVHICYIELDWHVAMEFK